MNRWHILLVCVLLVALSALWIFRETATPRVAPIVTNSSAEVMVSSVLKSNLPNTDVSASNRSGYLPTRPRLFKTTNYPPQTDEEKAQWDWWRTMRKMDSSFEWKAPIEFYGKVIDQFSNAIEGATVVVNWTTAIGASPNPQMTIVSGRNGLFSVTGIQGKRLGVNINKDDYLPTSNSYQSFEYSDFTDHLFYVPDPTNPVIFCLQKLMGAEPMYKFLPSGEITVDGVPLILDVQKGRVNVTGDLACYATLGKGRGDFGTADFTIMLEGLNGTGISQSGEEFLFRAPESGYQKTVSFFMNASDPNYCWTLKPRFYIRTRGGKYAAADVEVTLYRDLKSAGFSAILYFNPSGSRNLEFDQNKWINR